MSLGHSGREGIPKANSLWKEAVFVPRGTIVLITSTFVLYIGITK